MRQDLLQTLTQLLHRLGLKGPEGGGRFGFGVCSGIVRLQAVGVVVSFDASGDGKLFSLIGPRYDGVFVQFTKKLLENSNPISQNSQERLEIGLDRQPMAELDPNNLNSSKKIIPLK